MTQRRKRALSGTFTIDEYELKWELRNEAQFTTDGGLKGVQILVEMVDGPHKQLILEFPYNGHRITGITQLAERQNVTEEGIIAGTKLAMEAGWNPVSRGKVFIFEVDEAM